MADLRYEFSGSGEDGPATLSLYADVASYLERQGQRVAFSGNINGNLAGRHRLRADVRFSANIEDRQRLEERLPQSVFELQAEDFEAWIGAGLLVVAIRYPAVMRTGTWNFENGDHDFTQPQIVDLRVPPLKRLSGEPWQWLREGQNFLKPAISCYLKVAVKIFDPLKRVVADTKEDFEHSSIVSGGRPESDRRRF